MRTLPNQSSVIYRNGFSDKDYDEAIEALQDAKNQSKIKTRECSICYDSGHEANQCHHNPLVMARRAVASYKIWRCYHCDMVFTNYIDAEKHFGKRDDKPLCKRK